MALSRPVKSVVWRSLRTHVPCNVSAPPVSPAVRPVTRKPCPTNSPKKSFGSVRITSSPLATVSKKNIITIGTFCVETLRVVTHTKES